MKKIGELLGSEGINAATVLALSGTLIVLVAKGDVPCRLRMQCRGPCRTRFPGLNLRVRVMPACPSEQSA